MENNSYILKNKDVTKVLNGYFETIVLTTMSKTIPKMYPTL